MKVKIVKKPRKSKVNIAKLKKEIVAPKQASKAPPSKAVQQYLNFYDDIKTTNQKYDW